MTSSVLCDLRKICYARIAASPFAVALTLCLAVPVFAQTESMPAETAAAQSAAEQTQDKRPKRGRRTDSVQRKKPQEEDGYYGSFKSAVQNEPAANGDGYYSDIPKYKEAPVVPSPYTLNAVSPTAAANGLAPPAAASATQVVPTTKSFNYCPKEMGHPTLETAKSAFNKRDFRLALMMFDKLHRQGMCTDVVHYYIARCYQQNSQIAAALQNYEAVISRSKDAKLRQWATTASEQLERYSQHRTYDGQGNNFLRDSAGPASGGGGGGGGGG